MIKTWHFYVIGYPWSGCVHPIYVYCTCQYYSLVSTSKSNVFPDKGKCSIAMGCSNMHNDGVRLFTFVDNEQLWRIHTYKITRRWWHGPTSHSVLCIEHFIQDSFVGSGNTATRSELIACISIKYWGLLQSQSFWRNWKYQIVDHIYSSGSEIQNRYIPLFT